MFIYLIYWQLMLCLFEIFCLYVYYFLSCLLNILMKYSLDGEFFRLECFDQI